MVGVALVGVGRWGRQILRVLDSRCRVTGCCHKGHPATRQWLQHDYPHLHSTVDYHAVLQDPQTEAVVIATPIDTHASFARRALEAGKHVLVEKPLATTVADADALVELAEQHDRVLAVGHVFLYHPIMQKIRELTRQDPVCYAKLAWTKYGTFDEDIFWNLVCHDVAIACELFQARPCDATVLHHQRVVTACDVVTGRLTFAPKRECLVDVNRCAPTTRKSLTLVTEGGQVLSWDNDALYALRDRLPKPDLVYESREEPLALEVEAFLNHVTSGEPTRSGGALGRLVVEVVNQLLASRDGR